MKTDRIFIVGDIHGHYDTLIALLDKVSFSDSDQLIAVGDLINRGPKSLEVLNFFHSHKNTTSVLGNHDFLLPLAYHAPEVLKYESPKMLELGKEILNHKNGEKILQWMCSRPLMIVLKDYKHVISHAGVNPSWSIEDAYSFSKHLSTQISNSPKCHNLMQKLYGDEPKSWNELKHLNATYENNYNLERFIVNSFCRMRNLVCPIDSSPSTKDMLSLILDSSKAKTLNHQIPEIRPWFQWREFFSDQYPKEESEYKFVFGHWAALNGKTNSSHYIALDTGCGWEKLLRIYECGTERYYNQNCIV